MAGFWWYSGHVAAVLLNVSGGGGVSDVTASDSFAVSESAVAALFPAGTDTVTLTETATGQALVVAVDNGTLTDDGVATVGASNQVGVDTAAVTDALTSLVATANLTESVSVTDALSAMTVTFESTTEVFTLAESGLGFAAVSAVDGFTVGENAAVSTVSGGNATGTESLTVSEAIAAEGIAAVVESVAVSESVAPVADAVASDSFTVTDSASLAAPFTGVASGTAGITALVTTQASAGASSPAFDSTYITFDSTLTTWDGGYLGEFATVWIAPNEAADVAIQELISGTVEVG